MYKKPPQESSAALTSVHGLAVTVGDLLRSSKRGYTP